MEDREYITNIYEIYKGLLSDREREFFEYYYFEDLSMQEIADNNEVSKAYVGKLINTINDKLTKYELILKINSKNDKIRNIIKELDDETRNKIESIL